MTQELPRWKSHKIVEAAKVDGCFEQDGKFFWTLKIGSGDYVSVPASDALRRRVLPEGTDCATGYYVRYEDGYESWSPAKAFEEGYTVL